MTLRTKMTMLFIGIVTILLLVFCSAIYVLSEMHRHSEYKTRLRQEALTAATILFNKKEISPDILKLLTKNEMTALNKEEIILFNSNNQVIYKSSSVNKEIEKRTIDDIRLNKEFFWHQDEIEKFGMVFKNKNQDYIIVASAVDKYGLDKQRNLAILLSFGCLLIILISALLGSFFTKGLLRPLQQMINKIDNITASNLNQRLSVTNDKDELGQLAFRFNQMLDRLLKAFMLQRSFVSHASHELRTPLTAITGQIQVSLLANDNEHELRLMAKSVLEDVNQLNKLTNNLLDLTSIDTEENNIKFSLLNVIEALWQARTEVLKKYPDYQILISIEENELQIPQILGNESLIYTAFINLVENGAKFSLDNTLHIKIAHVNNHIEIKFQNKTKPIEEIELQNIFEPFMRGSNSKNTKGHGVGLSLTKRIIHLHKASITPQLKNNDSIEFIVKFNPSNYYP